MKSLEKQLQNSLALVLILILVILVLVANLSTRNVFEQFVTSSLENKANRLFSAFNKTDIKAMIRWKRLDPNYNITNSGFYYVIQFTHQGKIKQIASPSLNDTPLPLVDSNKPTVFHNVSGPDNQHLIVWSKQFSHNGKTSIISVAEDMSVLLENRKYFTLQFIAIGIIGFLILLLLQRYVIRRLFKHLDNSRQEIKQIEAGDRQKLSENVPTEIYPLVKEFNHSLSSMQQRIERSRNALGNLAHALKTPLSLLMQSLEQAEDPSQTNKPKHLESTLSQAKKQAERIRQLTDRELKRARLAGLGNSAERFDAEQELATLINVLKQAHPNKQLEVSCQIADEVKPFADREDMIELLGNLLDNAFKWAEGHVICHITQHTKTINLCIEDDGKGITASALTQLTQRGIRLDESVEGHGLGLAICKDIVNIYNGKIHFEQSVTLGGLSVTVTLPQNPQ